MGFPRQLLTQEVIIGSSEYMKINRQFAPITISIEYESDLVDLKNILLSAHRQETSNRRIFCSREPSDLQQKIQYMLDKLKL